MLWEKGLSARTAYLGATGPLYGDDLVGHFSHLLFTPRGGMEETSPSPFFYGGKMEQKLDEVEKEYLIRMRAVESDEEAFELAIGLKQYREMFKVDGRS